MTKQTLTLADGRRLPYRVEVSRRAKHVRLNMSFREGLVVVLPQGMNTRDVGDLLQANRAWVAKQLDRLGELAPPSPAALEPPQSLSLLALGESWRVRYHEITGPSVVLREQGDGSLLVSGETGNAALCHEVLRRWLARHAGKTLEPRLRRLSEETGLSYARMAVRGQRGRWGSCSSAKVINLNYKLLFLPPELVRHVLIHELCHTVEMNHSARFWALVRRHDPDVDTGRIALRGAWKHVPPWCV